MTGLEALEYAKIVDYTTDVALGKREPNKKLEESFNIIEKELREKAEIDDILNTGGGIWAKDGIVSKKLKALEIIRTRLLRGLAPNSYYDHYILFRDSDGSYIELQKEEWEILNEVLWNGML